MKRPAGFNPEMQPLEGSLTGMLPPDIPPEGSSLTLAPLIRDGVAAPNDPPNLKRDLIFLILQFLDEEKYSETVHLLEKESGVYFNMKYFEETVLAGEWDKAESYVSGFTKITESHHSAMIFFHIRWHKYFELIMRGEKVKAIDILNKELKFFEPSYPQHFKKAAHCLTVPSCMEISPLSAVNHVRSLRIKGAYEVCKVIVTHPIFGNKLNFPRFSNKRLRTLLSLQPPGGPQSTL